MNYFELRQMNREQLIAYMNKLSRSYTPKWRMQEDDPELGSALALIFADMYSDLIQKTAQIPAKHYIDFLNLQNPTQKSSSGAKGYATMTLSEGTLGGVMVKQGKPLIGADADGENLVFETTEDIMLIPAALENLFVIQSEKDQLVSLYNKSIQPEIQPFYLMPEDSTPNLQTHILTIEHSEVLNLKCAEAIELVIEDSQNPLREKATLDLLSDKGAASWSYQLGGKWVAFDSVTRGSQSLRLRNDKGIYLESPLIRLTLKNAKKVVCDALKLRPIAIASMPDALYVNEIEVSKRDGQIYGNPFYVYDAFYISSEEVFTKPGSLVDIQLDYVIESFPTPFDIPEPNIKWKNVLKVNDLKEVKEKEIVITDLILEYWNGIGWSKLETLVFDTHLFEVEVGEFTKANIRFICPEDFESTNVGAYNNRWLRMRILQVDNAYTLLGNYHVPKLKKMTLTYQYDKSGVMPSAMYKNEFLEETSISLRTPPLTLFNDYGSLKGKGLYLVFDKPLTGGPIKILFEMGTVKSPEMPRFKWQILKKVAGKMRWSDLEVLDETRHFAETGLLTFIGDEDHEKVRMLGKEGYWLRVMEIQEGIMPVRIKSIYLNTVCMTQKETVQSQYFELKQHEYDQTFKLDHENLESLALWVNEPYLSEEWLKSEELSYEIQKNLDGIVESIWVKWLPYEDLSSMNSETRGYLVNLYEGIIQFGNSIQGYLPQGNTPRNVRVDYAVNKGELGNVGAFTIQRLAESIPNINKVFNPLALYGGKAPETRAEALTRMSSALHHNQRAKSILDYDHLILAADHEIHRVKTLPHLNAEGKTELGCITSAILPKRPVQHQDYFRRIQQRVYHSMNSKLPCTLIPEKSFFVVEAKPVTIDVHFKGVIESIDHYLSVYQTIENQIHQYLDTYLGNKEQSGWQIGEIPDQQYLLCLLQVTEGLKGVDYLVLNAIVQEGYESREISIDSLKARPFFIIQGGTHKITLGLE